MSQNTPATIDTFRDVREQVNQRLIANGLAARRVPDSSSLEGAGVTQEDIDQLKADLSRLIQLEGKRGFWAGVFVNAIFFVLGLATPALVAVVNAGALPW